MSCIGATNAVTVATCTRTFNLGLQEDECRLKASIEKHPGQRRLTREKMWPKTNDTTLIEFIQVADRHTLLSITGFTRLAAPSD